jgi:hypothetical protein
MAERADELSQRFTEVNAAFIAFVAAIPPAQWEQTVGEGELRSVGMVAYHVAYGYGFHSRYFGAIAAGQPLPPLTRAEGDAINAKVAEESAEMSQAAVLEALRSAGEQAREWIRGLSDEQLDRRGEYLAGIAPHSVETFIKAAYLGHSQEHLQDIRGALQR